MNLNEQIVSLIKARDEKGLSLLYNNYSDTLYGIAIRVLKNESFAEDCIQKSLLKIWNAIDKYDASKSTLFTWMAQVVKNTALDTRRLKSFQKEEKTETIVPSVYSERVNNQELGGMDVEKLLGSLDPKYSEVLYFLYMEGYSQSELSEKLEIPLGTIKTRSKKAIDLLREKLNSEKNLFLGVFSIVLIIIILLLSKM